MSILLSNYDLAEKIKIPVLYISELLQAARLIEREFDYYGLCHHSLTLLGHKFGQYNGTTVYDVGDLLNQPQMKGKQVEFDIIVWYQAIVPFLTRVIEKDVLDYNCLSDYHQYLGNQLFPASKALKVILEMRRPATMSFHEMIADLKSNNYNDFDDEFPF